MQSRLFPASGGSQPTKTFTEAKNEYDQLYRATPNLPQSLVPVDGKIINDIPIKNAGGERNEEYYKWQFIYALITSGLYFKDYIGVEVYFPKGNKNAAPLKIDACIFDDKEWLTHYQKWRSDRNNTISLEFLRDHCIVVVEFKRGKDSIEKTLSTQLRPAMKEPDAEFVLGIIYDAERLYLFQKEGAKKIVRYDEKKNNGTGSTQNLSLLLPDSYFLTPSFNDVIRRINKPSVIDRTQRTINDLDVILSRSSVQVKDALSRILIILEKYSLFSQRGYQILIQTLAMKIFDEKRNQREPSTKLRFYVKDTELNFKKLHEKEAQEFVERMKTLYGEAQEKYHKILEYCEIDWKEDNHIRIVQSIVQEFQDYSLVLSQQTDLYQLVFYNFAQPFQKIVHAQFLTPPPVIEFLVRIVNPRKNEKVCDPCVGIADFLSVAYIESTHSGQGLNDENLWGVDIEASMLALAQLNMLLNGDGNAHLLKADGDGSIIYKINSDGTLVSLVPQLHKYDEKEGKADWDKWNDNTRLMKFDVVLTNPPFGEGRAYEAKNAAKREILEMYETYWKKKKPKRMDKGVLFLENAYHILTDNGRMGIVLSNAIASEAKSIPIIQWLLEKMRIVAIFDLPPGVFAETGVNITLIVAYKPTKDSLESLKANNYTVFSRSISKIGYEKKTKKRNVIFEPKYRLDQKTYEVMIDANGAEILDEEFSQIVKEFKEWAISQEEALQKLFLK
jgi:type I restriction enzyme M protein